MRNTFGNNIGITIYGESHGPCIGAVIDGLPAGIKLDLEYIKKRISFRKPYGSISTGRIEADEMVILSGYFNNCTTGTPLTIQFENKNIKSKDYVPEILRPSHADYVAYEKYHGFQDYRGGGHFSGRLTVVIVAIGAIFEQLLSFKNIKIASHILKMQELQDTPFSSNKELLEKQMDKCNNDIFSVLDENVKAKMLKRIEEVRANEDSIGAIVETSIINMPKGVGEPFFDSVESVLGHLLFSVPAVKGVEFGLGFEFSDYCGSKVNDSFCVIDNHIETISNFNGGINGGITNGMPIRIKTVIKPTPSIYKTQETINYKTMENTTISIVGRHDPCIAHRARVVIDSVCAIGLVDLLMQEFGKQYFEVIHD